MGGQNFFIGQQYGDYVIKELDKEKSIITNKKYWLCECIIHKTIRSIRQDVLIKGIKCQCTYKDKKAICIIENCDKDVFCNGYCSHHYYFYNKYNDPLYKPPIISKHCSICGISENDTRIIKTKENIYLCQRHYLQIYNFGRILERTKYDKNDIIECDNYAFIVLRDNNCNEISRAIIDKEDINKIKEYSWHLNDQGYVITWIGEEHIRIHRLLTEAKDNEVVDHKDHNTLNNRKYNLRKCTQANNTQNKALQKNNTSGVTGVFYHSINNKWIAQITCNKEKIHLGCFDNFEDAVDARKDAEIEHFKEFTYDPKNDYRLVGDHI